MTVHWLLDIQLLISVAFGGRTCSLQSKISHLLLERGCRVGTSLFSSLPDTHQLPIVEGPLVFPQMPKPRRLQPLSWRTGLQCGGSSATSGARLHLHGGLRALGLPERWLGRKCFVGFFFFLW